MDSQSRHIPIPSLKVWSHFVALVALSGHALASADALPSPPENRIRNLDSLVGSWKGGGTFALGDKTANETAKIAATWTCRATAAQYGVLCTFHVTGIPGVPAYEETDLLGFEPNSNAYHWYSVTNAGETHDHVAKPPQGKSFQFVYTGTQEGKPLKEVIDLDFGQDAKHATGRAETFVAGVSASVMQIELHK